ncbi:MAG: hypothetical protein EPN57_06580 [Paraburkholderia sp.]|nr:MAG: hypothetical protein EPN57_06580 [Paraburkholderia sp.]
MDFTAAGGCAEWRESAFFFMLPFRSVFCALMQHVCVRYCECPIFRFADGHWRENPSRARAHWGAVIVAN